MKKITTLLATLALLLGVIPSTTAIDYTETISAVVYLESYTSTDDEWVSQGTGFIISVDAIILTAAHVILDEDTHEPMEYVDICTIDDEYSIPDCKYSGRILAFDEYLDLALLYPAYEIDEYREETGEFIELEDAKNLNLPYVDLADYNPSLGDNLSVLGFPAASATPTITLSTGIVSGYTPLSLLFPELQDSEWIWEIETDAAVNQGNSGGPAYDNEERVVGVVYAEALNADGSMGKYGYIISNDVIYLWFLDLVKQDVLNKDFVDAIFNNDYNDYSEPDEDIDWSNVKFYHESVIFDDVGSVHPNISAINRLFNLGIINGYPDGTFKPNGEINRAELIKMVVEMVDKSDISHLGNCFPDVKNDWYAPYVCHAKNLGWISGYPDGTFKPANTANRMEALKIILNAFFNNKIPEVKDYSNVFDTALSAMDTDMNAWYWPYFEYSAMMNILDYQHIEHLQGETFNYLGGNNMTRKEVAETIYRLLNVYEEDLFAAAMGHLTCETGGLDKQKEALLLEAFNDANIAADYDEAIDLFNYYLADPYVEYLIISVSYDNCPEYLTEKDAFMAATVDATCTVFTADNILDPQLEEDTKDIYKYYGFDADDETLMDELTNTYSEDEDFNLTIYSALKRCAPEYIENPELFQ